MRRFLSISFILLALAVSAAGVAHAAVEGQICDPTDTTVGGTAVCESGLVCTADSGRNTCQKSSTQSPVDPRAAEAAARTAMEQGQATSYRFGLNYVMSMITGLFAWLVGVAALTLNFSMYYTVVNMGGYITNLTAIKTVWEILRDIGNILLIFGFLAIGISIIIDSGWYGGGQKLLPKLLIVAVFANFSLFAAEAMIDVGNLFATQIYRQINGGEIVAPMGATDAFMAVINKKGVAGVLMNKLGLASIYGQAMGKDKDGNNVVSSTGPWYMGFMSIIVFIVVAFVMFMLAFVLISRFIILILLIMVSPVGVIGLAVPGLQGWANKWWDTLFKQTITAPILLLMLYIALSVIVDDNFLGFGTTTPAWGGTQTGYIMEFAGTLLSYLIAMGLLLAVVYFAKTLSAVGAGWATKTAGKLSFGATAWAGRGMVGTGVGRGLLGNRFIKRGAVSDNRAVRYASRTFGFVGKQLQNRTYDIRSAPGAKQGLSATGINAGAPSSLTAKQLQEMQYGIKPTKEWFRKASQEYEDDVAALDRKTTLASGAPPALQNELRRMSDDEIAELRGIRQGQDRLVQALSPTAYGNLMKNKGILRSEKNVIRTNWENQFVNNATSQTALARMNEDERVALGGGILATPTVYENLSADDLDNIRSAKLQPGQKATIAAYVRDVHAGIVVPPVGSPLTQANLVTAAANPKFKAYYSIP